MKFFVSHKPLWLLLVISAFQIFNSVSSYMVNSNPYRHFVTLDREGKFNVEWLVDWDQSVVRFNLTVATKGAILFGLTKRRSEPPIEDMLIGGVYSNGKPYLSDRYAINNEAPRVDPTTNDWVLHAAYETETHTFLSVSTKFDTCDADYDLPITNDLTTLLWAYTDSDDERSWNFRNNRGLYDAYILDPDLSPNLDSLRRLEEKGVKMNISRFQMTSSLALPREDTRYHCHFFKAPTTSKRHIIGFSTEFPTENDRQHVHHLLVHRCRPPPGADADRFFNWATRTQGTECFFVGEPHDLPTEYCQEVIHLWGVGGRPIFFPDNAGLSMSADGSEYFMVQGHYDNPQLSDRTVTFTVEAYYTDNLRENEVGMLPLGELTPAATSIVIPPNSRNHVILGHCPSSCLQNMLPSEGVKVFAGFLHTHLLGNGVRFLHFRGNQELPWIANDDDYNFDYQQFRLLIEERKIYPGDQLGMRCSYDTRSRNGATVVGGHSTRDEMCTGHLYYYSKSPIRFAFCRSELRTEEYMNRLGIRNTTWDPSRRQMMITEPRRYAGLTVYDYANRYIKWTPELREAIQRDHKFQPQGTQCPIVDNTPPDLAEWQASERPAWNPALRGIPRYKKPGQCVRPSTPWGDMRHANSLLRQPQLQFQPKQPSSLSTVHKTGPIGGLAGVGGGWGNNL